MRKILLSFFAILLLSVCSMAQSQRVSGTVTGEDGSPIAGVTIIIKGTAHGTVTGTDGKYSMVVTKDGILSYSFIGMLTDNVGVNNRTVIDVIMKVASEALDDVIVVAYGTAKKESFTGSVGTIDAGNIVKRNVSTVSKALEGNVAGLQATGGSGQPGSDANLLIRGFGSLNASNKPLYVVDGIPYDGNISAINPNDIAGISVLKDASSSALYGARGSNGVVIITTKKGKAGNAKVNVKMDFGISSPALKRYETVDEYDFMSLSYQAVKNAGTGNINTYMNELGGEQYNPFNVASNKLLDPATGAPDRSAKLRWHEDWIDEATRDVSSRQEYQLSVSGGTDKTSYLISGGYLKDNGLLRRTDFSRFSGRVSVDNQTKEWMKLGLSAAFSHTKKNFSHEDNTYYANVWFTGQNMGPIYPVYEKDAQGNTVLDVSGNRVFDYSEDRPYASRGNSVGTLFYDKQGDLSDNMSGRSYVTFDTDKDIAFIKDLSLTVNFGFDYYGANFSKYQNPMYGDAADINGAVSRGSERSMSYTFNQLLTYKKSIHKHNLELLLGHEYYSLNGSILRGEVTGLAFPDVSELVVGASISDLYSYSINYNVESYLSRLNYNYNDKYYFSASYRRDGSSRFHLDSRWGNFWSVGASWRVSEESFMKPIEWINNLTVKASYGSQGNDNLNTYYAWQGLYTYKANANAGGVFPQSIENKSLKWEKNNNFNTGIELRVLDNRIGLEIEYFQKKTVDLLMNRKLALSSGHSSYLDNVGDMVNKGFDFTLTGSPIRNTNFRWDVSLMGSVVRNKVTRLNDGLQNLSPNSVFITKVGQPLNSFYPVMHAGVDPDTGTQLYKYLDEKSGEMIVTNSYPTASNKRSEANLAGSRIPKIYGSFSNAFEYKKFDLSFMFTYSIGGKVMDSNYFQMMGRSLRSLGITFHQDMLSSWKSPGDITNVPQIEYGISKNYTDFYLKDASYLSLKNITLGYTFNFLSMKKIGIESLRLSVTANNLFTTTKFKGMNPQYNFSGMTDYAYPPVRNVSFGIDFNF